MKREHSTVFVVDDDLSVRESVALLLHSSGYRVKVYASAKKFLASVQSNNGPSCLILDVKMPGLNGLELQQALLSMDLDIPIIFITGHGDISMSVKVMKKGAVEFLTKPFDDVDLLAAVEEAIQKDFQAQAELDKKKNIRKRLESLTPREYEIMTYLISGMLNKQIAYSLNISERTVKAHRKKVMEKTGIESVAQLVRLTEKAGISPAKISS